VHRSTIIDTLQLAISDVQRLAIRQNLNLLATRQELSIAAGALRQARVYQFNPDLTLQSAGDRGTDGPFQVLLTQEIEWAGQRGLRISAAREGQARATAFVQNAARVSLASASVGFYRAFASERRLEVAQDALALTERLVAAVRTQLAEGEISTLEANLAEIEAGRARGRVLSAQRAELGAAFELKQLLGLRPETAVRLVSDSLNTSRPLGEQASPSEDSLVALALARRPDLAASEAAIRELERLSSLSRRSAFPNVRIGAVVERAESGGSADLGPAIGLSIPLFNRNQGLVDQRRALTEQARLNQRATELGIRNDVLESARAYRTASEEVAVFETTVVRPARANIELLETAYRAGKIALPTLLLLRNQLLDAEFGYWDAWLAQHEALIRLEAATGALTPSAAALQPLKATSVDGPTKSDSSSRTSS
jgi:cobalt-zinc-cadmium efflux system outer membrane protein